MRPVRERDTPHPSYLRFPHPYPKTTVHFTVVRNGVIQVAFTQQAEVSDYLLHQGRFQSHTNSPSSGARSTCQAAELDSTLVSSAVTRLHRGSSWRHITTAPRSTLTLHASAVPSGARKQNR
jgi:hypothetical protein